jgi:AcrR family transcriptional regulator
MVSVHSPVKGVGVATRDRLLDAAAHVMRTRGLARATTREIARAAGYSEATLYKHFEDKSDLFLAVLHERLPSFLPFVDQLFSGPDEVPLRDRLAAVARTAIAFYEESFPMVASVFSEPELLAAHRTAAAGRGGGPHRPAEAVVRYLRAEQQRGRVRDGADCEAAAGLLLGACLQYAFLRSYSQQPADPEAVAAHARALADTLVAGLTPASQHARPHTP